MKKKNSKLDWIGLDFKATRKTGKNNNNGKSYANLYEVGTLAVDGCAVTFGTARRGLGGSQPRWMDGWMDGI